jgi:membrane-associated protease RseP (regulator of RpoE activity)
MLITGLNMMPVSQLDGGHVSYALFGRRPAHALAWLVVAAAIVFIVHWGRYEWTPMLALVVLLRPAHPPTSDDYVPLGWGRRLIGLASLLIPILCFVPMPIQSG